MDLLSDASCLIRIGLLDDIGTFFGFANDLFDLFVLGPIANSSILDEENSVIAVSRHSLDARTRRDKRRVTFSESSSLSC